MFSFNVQIINLNSTKVIYLIYKTQTKTWERNNKTMAYLIGAAIFWLKFSVFKIPFDWRNYFYEERGIKLVLYVFSSLLMKYNLHKYFIIYLSEADKPKAIRLVNLIQIEKLRFSPNFIQILWRSTIFVGVGNWNAS